MKAFFDGWKTGAAAAYAVSLPLFLSITAIRAQWIWFFIYLVIWAWSVLTVVGLIKKQSYQGGLSDGFHKGMLHAKASGQVPFEESKRAWRN